VKLNIEMSMAHLIKKIATDRSQNSDLFIVRGFHSNAFNCCSHDSSSLPPSRQTTSMLKNVFGRDQRSPPVTDNTLSSNGILRTEEFRMQSEPAKDLEMQQRIHYEQNGHDESSVISYDNVAWADTDWPRTNQEEQDALVPRDSQTVSFANDEAALIPPAPAVLRPA